MIATAPSTATQGLAHSDDMHAGAEHLQKGDDVIDEFVEAALTMPQAYVARVVPVGDIDIMVGEKGLRRATQQRRKMSRHRRHQEHSGLRRRYVFFKVQQSAERCAMNRRLAHRGEPAAYIDSLNSEGGPMVAQPCALRRARKWPPQPGGAHCAAFQGAGAQARLQRGRQKPAPVQPCRNTPESSDRSLSVTDRLRCWHGGCMYAGEGGCG